MKHPYNFSIIIPYHKGESYLKACLNSLVATTQPSDEILVVVNSADKTIHDLSLHSDRVTYLNIYEGIGHAKAVNEGVKFASHEYVIITDHDLVFQPGWIEALWKLYASDSSIGAVSCKVLNTRSQRVLDYGIAYTDFNLGHPFMDLPSNHPLVQEDRMAQMICTGGFLIKKRDLIQVGGFEESFGTLYTDLDMCLKLKRVGLKVAAAANALAYHFGGDFSLIKRSYKDGYLKADVKGAFMRNNADVLEPDMDDYYKMSAIYFKKTFGNFGKYFFCNMMNVVDPTWYEKVAQANGAEKYDRIHRPSSHRDAANIGLFEILGYDLMALGVPIAYFVDRFVCITNNTFWWNERRGGESDIVVDRNANILPVREVIY